MPLNWTGPEATYADYRDFINYTASSITLDPHLHQATFFSDGPNYYMTMSRELEDRIDELVRKKVEEILNAKGFILGQIPEQADEESYDRIMENNT